MHKRTQLIEWHIAEDDADWEHLTAPIPLDTIPITDRCQRLLRILWRVATLFLLVAGVGPGVWHAERPKDQPAINWRRQQRVASADDFWAPEYSMETRFFIYYFRQHDAPAVTAVALQIDNLYTTLRRNFGLSLPSDTEKLVIDVSVMQPPGQVIPWGNASHRFRVPSPMVYPTSLELTAAQLLAQSIALQQIEHLLAEANQQYQIQLTWRPLLNGLRLWQVWDMDLPLAVWQEEVMQWLYVDLPAVDPGQPLMLPDRYVELCASHKLWMSSPLQINIPLGCTSLDQEALLFPIWDPRDPLTHLDQLTLLLPPNEYMVGLGTLYSAHRPGQTIALATLIDYAVTTYGYEHLPALLTGLGQYETWDSLIAAVYGVSRTEFEAGWQVYLITRYSVLRDTSVYLPR